VHLFRAGRRENPAAPEYFYSETHPAECAERIVIVSDPPRIL
jgi:hypothetical protein